MKVAQPKAAKNRQPLAQERVKAGQRSVGNRKATLSVPRADGTEKTAQAPSLPSPRKPRMTIPPHLTLEEFVLHNPGQDGSTGGADEDGGCSESWAEGDIESVMMKVTNLTNLLRAVASPRPSTAPNLELDRFSEVADLNPARLTLTPRHSVAKPCVSPSGTCNTPSVSPSARPSMIISGMLDDVADAIRTMSQESMTVDSLREALTTAEARTEAAEKETREFRERLQKAETENQELREQLQAAEIGTEARRKQVQTAEALQQQMRTAELLAEAVKEQLQTCRQAASESVCAACGHRTPPVTEVDRGSFGVAIDSSTASSQIRSGKGSLENLSMPPTWLWSGLPVTERVHATSKSNVLQGRPVSPVRPHLQSCDKLLASLSPRGASIGSLTSSSRSPLCTISTVQKPILRERPRSLSPTMSRPCQSSSFIPVTTISSGSRQSPRRCSSSPAHREGDCISAQRSIGYAGMSSPSRETHPLSSPRHTFTVDVPNAISPVRVAQKVTVLPRVKSCERTTTAGASGKAKQWRLKWVLE